MTKKCVVCEGDLRPSDVPGHNLYVCLDPGCGELQQLLTNGSTVPLSSFLQRNAMGDDRTRAAISTPQIATVKSLLDVYESTTRFFNYDLATAGASMRTILAQIENRIDTAIATFTGLDLVSEEAADGLAALREARELVSVLPPRSRGLRKEPADAKDVPTSE